MVSFSFSCIETYFSDERITSMKNTLIVNFLGGPGLGKSTMCSSLFTRLKIAGIECEFALEYAKDLVFEEGLKKLNNQIYVFAKQLQRIKRLNGKVDVIVTDSPALLSYIYAQDDEITFKKLIVEEYNKLNSLNLVIKRKHTYNPNGRLHTLQEAIRIDERILQCLNENKIAYREIDSDISVLDSISEEIIKNIRDGRQ